MPGHARYPKARADGFSENYKNDILWLIVLRAVKVRDSLKNWGYIDSDKCASCSRKETIDHCFLNCVRVKRVWSFFSPVLSSLLGFPFLPSCTRVFFFRWAPVSPKKAQLARFLIKTILYGVWKFRNKATFHNGNDTPEGMIRYILSDVKNRVACDFFRLPFSDFKNAWEAPGLCRVDGDSYKLL